VKEAIPGKAMSLLLISALAVSGPVQSACSWDSPGVNPFMGDVVAAVDRYEDIPPHVRAKLKQRMAQRRYDELATIKRDSIAGAFQYSNLRDMHFGRGTVCRSVTRDRWSSAMEERGLVYCEEGHCLIVPTVCRNVSRITRLEQKRASNDQPPPAPAPLDLPFAAGADPGALEFEAPSAGPSFASLIQDVPTVPVTVSSPGTSHAAAPRTQPRDSSWASFAGLPLATAAPIFVADNSLPRSALQSPPVVTSSLPPVPGVVPPPSVVPVINPAPMVPPVIVSIPTVPPMTEQPVVATPPGPVSAVTPAPAPLPSPDSSIGPQAAPVVEPTPPMTPPVQGLTPAVLSVPNLPGVPEVPPVPTQPVALNVPVPSGPSGSPTAGPVAPTVDDSVDQVVATAPIPEPGTLALMGLGLALVVWMTRRGRGGLISPR
jgi:hypothetical protein